MDSDQGTSYLQQARAAISQFASPASEWSDMASPAIVKSNRSSPPLPSEQEFISNDGGSSLSDDSFDRVLLAALDAADEAQRELGDESPLDSPDGNIVPGHPNTTVMPVENFTADNTEAVRLTDSDESSRRLSDSSTQHGNRDGDRDPHSHADISTQPQSPLVSAHPIAASDTTGHHLDAAVDSDSGDGSIVFDLGDEGFKRTPRTAPKAPPAEVTTPIGASNLTTGSQASIPPEAIHQARLLNSTDSQSIWLSSHDNSSGKESQLNSIADSNAGEAERSLHRRSPPTGASSRSEHPTLRNVRELAENVRYKAEMLQHTIQQETIRISPPKSVPTSVVSNAAAVAKVHFRSPAATFPAVHVPIAHDGSPHVRISASSEFRTHDRCIAERKFRHVHVLSEDELQQMRLRPSAIPLVQRLLADMGAVPIYKPAHHAVDRIFFPTAGNARIAPLSTVTPSTNRTPLRSQYLTSNAPAVVAAPYSVDLTMRLDNRPTQSILRTPQITVRARRTETPSPLLDRAFKQIQESNALLARTRS